jgi:hypothetical protein
MDFMVIRGSWTYAHRDVIKKMGCKWDGDGWQAPDQDVYQQIMALKGSPGKEEWTLTIHGDAGFKSGIGRWAWMCRHHLPPFRVVGVEQAPIRDVNAAEAMAILRGAEAGLNQWVPSGAGTVFVRSDNTAVLGDLDSRSPRMDEVRRIREFLRTHPKLRVHLKHIPAHGKARGTAGWSNQLVDEMSNLRGDAGRARMKGLI